MKKTIFLILVYLFIFSSQANAKISIDNYVANNEQVYVIKGYLYNLTRRDVVLPENLKRYTPHITDAIVWLNEKHSSNQVFKIKDINDNNAAIILNAIQNINNFVLADIPKTMVEAVLRNWNTLGTRVMIEKTNNILSLKLSPFSIYSTRHLVYRYNEEASLTNE